MQGKASHIETTRTEALWLIEKYEDLIRGEEKCREEFLIESEKRINDYKERLSFYSSLFNAEIEVEDQAKDQPIGDKEGSQNSRSAEQINKRDEIERLIQESDRLLTASEVTTELVRRFPYLGAIDPSSLAKTVTSALYILQNRSDGVIDRVNIRKTYYYGPKEWFSDGTLKKEFSDKVNSPNDLKFL